LTVIFIKLRVNLGGGFKFMKILVLNDKFPPETKGGADVMSWRFAQKLIQASHQVSVLTTTDERNREGMVEEDSLKIYRLFFKFYPRWMAYLGLYNPKAVKKLKEVVKAEEPDLVWAHNVHCALSYACLRKAKKMGRPVVLTVHDAMPFCYKKFDCTINHEDKSQNPRLAYRHRPWRCLQCQKKRYFPLRNFFIRYIFNHYLDKVLAVSAEHQKLLQANKVRCDGYIYNGFDNFESLPTQEEINNFKNRFGLGNEKVIFWSGRLSGAKGSFQTLLALEQVIKKIPNVILLIAARINESSQNFLKKAKEIGIKEKVVITDWLENKDLATAYQVCDLVIYPSICFDTFGLVVLEAMAAKKPVMATCFGGPKEVVTNDLTGYVFNPFNIPDFSEKIIRILSDEKLATQMGQAGYKKFKEKFTLDKVFREYLDVFQEILI